MIQVADDSVALQIGFSSNAATKQAACTAAQISYACRVRHVDAAEMSVPNSNLHTGRWHGLMNVLRTYVESLRHLFIFDVSRSVS